ncbi:Thrombospondin-4 [Nymphon striatum]|nr:Thrombospondin-4 [Nymphon striatum]
MLHRVSLLECLPPLYKRQSNSSTGELRYPTCRDQPCFRGVRCQDTSTGRRCGSCPRGFTGDGQSCKRKIITCTDRPCYPGVTCMTKPSGEYLCDKCPPNYSGDGRRCVKINSCTSRSCYPGVTCINTSENPSGFKCGPCPRGCHGNGTHCQDIDETITHIDKAPLSDRVLLAEFNQSKYKDRSLGTLLSFNPTAATM